MSDLETQRFRGRDVVKGWGAQVLRAQTYQTTQRVRWSGDEPCRDCFCDPGELHVPTCCVETCPGCQGQLLGCVCAIAHEILAGWPPVGH